MTTLFERGGVIDVDTHLTEPPDVWTARMASKWGDAIPHVERIAGEDVWMSAGERIGKPGSSSMAGFDGWVPNCPATFDDIDVSMFDAAARLAFMDAQGVRAEVLFPNTGGFGGSSFLKLGPELAGECVRAYNDFLVDWSSADPNRLLPMATTPFWDVDRAVAELTRAIGNGLRGINFCNQPDGSGQPPLGSRHWDPIWALAQEAGVPITFHIGGGDIGHLMVDTAGMGFSLHFAKVSSLIMADNMRCIADLIFGGICHRFPDLKFVSIESGVGWVPGLLETFDWQWRNGGIHRDHPEYDLVPSEYFRRQIYACFWFEEASARHTISAFPDNVLFETDYPHPTCQHPGPATPARLPRDYAEAALGSLPDDVVTKVLHDNATKVFGLSPA